jgi:hypothetical protein
MKTSVERDWSTILSRASVFICLLIISCGRPKDTIFPKGILKPEEMADVMVDVHLVEGARSGERIMGDSLALDAYYQEIFQRHGLTAEQYQENFAFYSRHPGDFAEVFDVVVQRLSVMESELSGENQDQSD